MDEYKDNPIAVEQWIENLTDSERAIYDRGYAIALMGVLEQISESKRRIFNRLFDVEDVETHRLFQSRIDLLDKYEEHYSKRVSNLEPA